MNHWSIISKSLLFTHQKDSLQTRNTLTKTWNEAQAYSVIKQLIKWESSDYLFFTVFGYNIIFLNDRELISGYLISTLRNNLSFACHFQKHKQEMTQVELVLQNMLN